MARMMVFIDGENIVARFQTMRDEGWIPKDEPGQVQSQEDVYVWHPYTFDSGTHSVIRATYYTYIVGSDERVTEAERLLKRLGFQSSLATQRPTTLYPRVFKKPKRAARAKGVDIQMTVDILTHTYQNNLDVVCLVSGDGDYVPLIDEVMRNGKQVYLSAFSSGLSPLLESKVDQFRNLDEVYFKPQR